MKKLFLNKILNMKQNKIYDGNESNVFTYILKRTKN